MKRLLLGSHGIGALPALLDRDPAGARVAFVPTAAHPDPESKFWVQADRTQLAALACDTVTLDVLDRSPSDVASALEAIEIVFVTGGSTALLLEHARRSGFFDIVRRQAETGAIAYVGTSAGAALAGPDGMALVDFVVLPHADHEGAAERHAARVAASPGVEFVPLRDDEAVLVRGGSWSVVPSPLLA